MQLSPTVEGMGVVTTKVLVDGANVSTTVLVNEIRISRLINRIPTAYVDIWDGNSSVEDFKESESAVFLPGKPIEIQVGYSANTKTVFKGVVIKQAVSLRTPQAGTKLTVVAKDNAIKMTLGRNNLISKSTTDSEMMTKLIEQHGLEAEVSSTSNELEELVQFHASDWDFLLTRAEANGFVVSVVDGKVICGKPGENSDTSLDLTFGFDVQGFDLEIDATTQVEKVTCSAWDYAEQKVVAATAESNNLNSVGNLSSTELARALNIGNRELQTNAFVGKDGVESWARAALVKAEMAKLRGWIKISGDDAVTTAMFAKLDGFGSRYDGKAWIGGVEHKIGVNGWLTKLEVGLNPKWFSVSHSTSEPIASGLLPGVTGLQSGIVKGIVDDPLEQGRILVHIPILGETSDPIWARQATFYATNDAGNFFYPEEGDEVVLSFINDDPRFPVVLGALHNKDSRKTKLTPAEGNPKKAFTSRSGIQIEFDDENKVLTLTTPEQNQAVFSDKDKQIQITDQNGNTITLSSDGIALKSENAIALDAPKITLSADQTVSVSGGESISATGGSISVSADESFSASGGESASVSSGGETSVNGSMVMIN